MKVDFSPDFYRQYKKANVRIRNSVDERVAIFIKNPHDLILNNHSLREPYQGLRSIDITSNWRAIYKEIQEEGEASAYFVLLGTHELYEKEIGSS